MDTNSVAIAFIVAGAMLFFLGLAVEAAELWVKFLVKFIPCVFGMFMMFLGGLVIYLPGFIHG